MKSPFNLPVRIEDDQYIVAADCELIMTNYDATPAELEAIVMSINNLPNAVKLLGQALPIIDAHRRNSLGDGDLIASAIRNFLRIMK